MKCALIGVCSKYGVAKAYDNIFVENQDLDNFRTNITKSTKMVKTMKSEL